jgi:hypothetical protein
MAYTVPLPSTNAKVCTHKFGSVCAAIEEYVTTLHFLRHWSGRGKIDPARKLAPVAPRFSAPSGTRWSDAGRVEDRSMENAGRIRELNDAFRRSFVGGRIMLTAGVNALPEIDKVAVLAMVRGFDDFSPDNDPHGEHDFVAIEHSGERYFAKIDCYDLGMRHGSEEPANPAKTVRVLTIMRADEY